MGKILVLLHWNKTVVYRKAHNLTIHCSSVSEMNGWMLFLLVTKYLNKNQGKGWNIIQEFLFLLGMSWVMLLGKTLETDRGVVDSNFQVSIFEMSFQWPRALVHISALNFFYFSGTSCKNIKLNWYLVVLMKCYYKSQVLSFNTLAHVQTE